ncbi:hypothetical protein E2542_SST26065 [Spatholobus suberectus]|nr:hypothetical protein E2542_SST26065 [Spatholobus suberectus]
MNLESPRGHHCPQAMRSRERGSDRGQSSLQGSNGEVPLSVAVGLGAEPPRMEAPPSSSPLRVKGTERQRQCRGFLCSDKIK